MMMAPQQYFNRINKKKKCFSLWKIAFPGFDPDLELIRQDTLSIASFCIIQIRRWLEGQGTIHHIKMTSLNTGLLIEPKMA